MKLIVGLGNPGLKYANTRHNIGFKIVNLLAKRYNIRIKSQRFGAKIGRGLIGTDEAILALPQKFMNVSGEPIQALVDSEKTAIDNLLVVCDDVNLQLGVLRIRKGGSAGGHKGLKSVIECLGRDDFARLRIGIGTMGPLGLLHVKATDGTDFVFNSTKGNVGIGTSGDITHYVLGSFSRHEAKLLPVVLSRAAEACESWVCNGTKITAARYNKKICY